MTDNRPPILDVINVTITLSPESRALLEGQSAFSHAAIEADRRRWEAHVARNYQLLEQYGVEGALAIIKAEREERGQRTNTTEDTTP